MKKQFTVRRMTLDAIMLALMCVIGMFSVPLGANIKVSLQLLIVFIICLNLPYVLDSIFITSLYLLLGLFMPVYAGFSIGVSPTFGFVIGFVFMCPVIYFINKIPKNNHVFRMFIACLAGLIICYLFGTIFMMLYLKLSFEATILISIVPYIPFDIFKIIVAILITLILPRRLFVK